MNLTQTRGDTMSYTFQRHASDGTVITTTPESMIFTVKGSWNTSTIKIEKNIEDMAMDNDGVWRFTIEPTETAKMSYGRYFYDLQITDNGSVTTVAKGQFILTEEATWTAGEEA